MNDLELISWFVLKVRFQRAVLAKERLTKPDIEVFLPMEMRPVLTKGKKECIKLMPIFSDLIFVKTTFQNISDICGVYKDMFYQSELIDGSRRAIRIPEDQMTKFINFISGNYEDIDCKRTKLKSGEKIIIKSGVFKGSMIVYKGVKGKENKEYKIEINGIDWKFTEQSLNKNILSRI